VERAPLPDGPAPDERGVAENGFGRLAVRHYAQAMETQPPPYTLATLSHRLFPRSGSHQAERPPGTELLGRFLEVTSGVVLVSIRRC
jgi:hypothetical protein